MAASSTNNQGQRGPQTNKDRWNNPEGQNYRSQVVNFINNTTTTTLDFTTLPIKHFGEINAQTDLAGIDLKKIELCDYEIKNVIFDDGEFDALISNVKFINVSFVNANFYKSSLDKVNFDDKTILDEANFSKSSLINIIGFDDNTIKTTIIFTTPSYRKLVWKFFNDNVQLDNATVFVNVNTKNLNSSETKELKEYINWYQQLTLQLRRKHLKLTRNNLNFFMAILLTKYWNSFWILAGWSFAWISFIAKLITLWPNFFEFKHDSLKTWNWWDGFYYCLVTFTTLGYGDVVPTSISAQIVAGLVAISGYFTLGLVIYIVAKKADTKF